MHIYFVYGIIPFYRLEDVFWQFAFNFCVPVVYCRFGLIPYSHNINCLYYSRLLILLLSMHSDFTWIVSDAMTGQFEIDILTFLYFCLDLTKVRLCSAVVFLWRLKCETCCTNVVLTQIATETGFFGTMAIRKILRWDDRPKFSKFLSWMDGHTPITLRCEQVIAVLCTGYAQGPFKTF